MKKWGRLFVFLVGFGGFLFFPTTHVRSQSFNDAVEVTKINGALLSNNLFFTGQVRNNLPWDVRDVNILVFFPDQDIETSTTIDFIGAGEQADFTAVLSYKEGLDRYVAYASDYRFQTNDVAGLLERFWAANDDFVFRKVAPTVFSRMTPSAWDGLGVCIAVGPRGSDYPNIETILNDLMCLEGLRAAGRANEAQEVLDLLAWYEAQEAQELFEIQLLLAQDAITVLDSFPILSGMNAEELNMSILVERSLRGMGSSAMEALFQALNSESLLVQQVAEKLLAGTGENALISTFDEADIKAFSELLIYLQESGRAESTVQLLEAFEALEDEDTRSKITQTILGFGPSAVPYLVESLAHPSLQVVANAERLLLGLGEQSLPALVQAAESAGISMEGTEDVQAYIERLRENADAQILMRIETVYLEGARLVAAEDCAGAVNFYHGLFNIRYPLPQYGEEVTQAYLCLAEESKDAKRYDQARSYFEEALRLFPESAKAHRGIVKLLLRENKLFMGLGAVSFLIFLLTAFMSSDDALDKALRKV